MEFFLLKKNLIEHCEKTVNKSKQKFDYRQYFVCERVSQNRYQWEKFFANAPNDQEKDEQRFTKTGTTKINK